jgi:hypothetical protein
MSWRNLPVRRNRDDSSAVEQDVIDAFAGCHPLTYTVFDDPVFTPLDEPYHHLYTAQSESRGMTMDTYWFPSEYMVVRFIYPTRVTVPTGRAVDFDGVPCRIGV